MRRLLASLAIAVALLAIGLSCGQTRATNHLNPEPAYLLLDLMDSLAAYAPPDTSIALRLQSLSDSAREALTDSVVSSLRTIPAIGKSLDRLLDTRAYDLYYRQARKSKDLHRKVLCMLPYGRIPAPGGIWSSLREVMDNRDIIRKWLDTTPTSIDLQNCRAIAERWLPPDDHELAPVHFILDGNFSAFTNDGEIVVDLYGFSISDLPRQNRYEHLLDVRPDDFEAVLAHELHHIWARPHLRGLVMRDTWQENFITLMYRRILSEGLAMHCNPPDGLNRAMKEDTAIVVHWLRQVDSLVTGIRADEITSEQAWEWNRSSYHDAAVQQMRAYLSRQGLTAAEVDSVVSVRGADRPTAVYTLGWWAVSRISQDGQNTAAYLELIQHPGQMIEMYNSHIPDSADSLRISWTL